MTITLINASGRLKTFTLPHESYCKARGRCACTVTPGRDPRRVPSSLTLAADARIGNADEAVLAVPGIERALRSGDLRVERKPPTPAKSISANTNNRRTGKKTRGDT